MMTRVCIRTSTWTTAASDPVHWSEISPADALEIDCRVRPDLSPPVNEEGEVCPWPWDPQQLTGAPIGMYHCPYCDAMVVAGVPHPDYRVNSWASSTGPCVTHDEPSHARCRVHECCIGKPGAECRLKEPPE
jgi:hypothetical protein